MKWLKQGLLLALILGAAKARAQFRDREPHLGYLYPAGGQQGSVIQIIAGGQHLNEAETVRVSGEEVEAWISRIVEPLSQKDFRGVQRQITQLQRKWVAGERRDRGEAANIKAGDLDLPDHPFLESLEELSLPDLKRLADCYRGQKFSKQIAELAVIVVAIGANASPGDRELRIETAAGLTNPLRFQVGVLPEICEQEPNDSRTSITTLVNVPVLLNGQILPGDVDRFRFRARVGQRLVIGAQARQLIPYLADAVPGWFQATLSLCDGNGREIAFADDYRFDPDPVLFYKVSADGEYEIEIRDALYRGREDFVYRLSVGEQPFVQWIFPLGGLESVATITEIGGWNLSRRFISLDTQPGGDAIRQTVLRQEPWLSNHILYAVDTTPQCDEAESNDSDEHAQPIVLPRIVNGRIEPPGDVDVFQFEGRAGDTVVAEVLARRLASPLDSLLRLLDVSGRIIEWNDDHEDRTTGLLTHHADSYLEARLPEDGLYRVHVADTQLHGGKAYGYRLRVSPPQPDFAIWATPSSINIPFLRTAPVCLYASRKDGFQGDIEVILKNAPAGFSLDGGRIPAGRDRICMTLSVPSERARPPLALHLEGRAKVAGQYILRPVVPAEDMMQAFFYRHLAPAQELLVTAGNRKRDVPAIQIRGLDFLKIPLGGTAQIIVETPPNPRIREIKLELYEAPEGLGLQETVVTPDGLAITLKADGAIMTAGYADNLIIEVFAEIISGKPDGPAPAQKRRVSLGVLPAVPFEIVQ